MPRTAGALNLSSIVPRPAIKDLSGLQVVKNDSSLLYIMHKFPQLKKLRINVDNDQMENLRVYDQLLAAESNISASTLAQFISYATKVPDYDIQIWIKEATIVGTLRKYSETASASMVGPVVLKYFNYPGRDRSDTNERNAMLQLQNPQTIVRTLRGFGVTYYPFDQELPHLDLIESFGGSINSLQLTIGSEKIKRIPTDTHRDLFNLATGYFLDHIFQHCTNLTQLYIEETTLNRCNPNISRSKSITHVHLFLVILHKDVLSELSARLPSLKHLYIYQCRSSKLPIDSNKYVKIDMAYISFDVVDVRDWWNLAVSAVVVKVSTEKGDKYCKVVIHRELKSLVAASLMMDEYDNVNIIDTHHVKIHIRCKSIKTFRLRMDDIPPIELSGAVEE